MKELKKILGEHLKNMREEKFKVVAEFAREMEVSNAQFIHDIEKGKKLPRLEIIIKYYKILNKSFEELLFPLLDISEISKEFKIIIKKLERIQIWPDKWQSLKTIINSFYKEVESVLPQKIILEKSKREEGREDSKES